MCAAAALQSGPLMSVDGMENAEVVYSGVPLSHLMALMISQASERVILST